MWMRRKKEILKVIIFIFVKREKMLKEVIPIDVKCPGARYFAQFTLAWMTQDLIQKIFLTFLLVN